MRLCSLIADLFEKDENIEYLLNWIQVILFYFAQYFRTLNANQISVFKAVLKNVLNRYSHVQKVTNENRFTIEFLMNSLEIANTAIDI